MKKTLEHISKKEFDKLRKSGMLWEFFPECLSDVYEYRLMVSAIEKCIEKDFEKMWFSDWTINKN